MSKANFKPGDYVLATKYSDGDPMDHWAIGFYDRYEDGRHYIVNDKGLQFRRNGFRRAEKIYPEVGDRFLDDIFAIEKSSSSVWSWRRHFEREIKEGWV